jgi:hypothetical protein
VHYPRNDVAGTVFPIKKEAGNDPPDVWIYPYGFSFNGKAHEIGLESKMEDMEG